MTVTIDTGWHPLVDGCPSDWASGWGQDRYGVYEEFTFGEVTYFIFGSDDDFGEVGNVPLLSERMDETQVGPLDTGIQMKGVDLSPWDAYQYVYVRALGVVPNRAYKIDPGYIYEFTTN